MAISQDAVTAYYRLHAARQIQESITEQESTTYYVFQGGHVPYDNGTPDLIYNNDEFTQILPYQQMIQGKIVTNNDVALVVRSIQYASGKAYAMFDDQDDFLYDRDFYVTVNSGDNYHVFKCLDNNLGAVSTITPDFTVASAADEFQYRSSDGYVWKYLYTFTATQDRKFTTDSFQPVYSNTAVTAAARPGIIDIIKVEEPGRGYDNYLSGTFATADLSVNGDTTLFAIGNNSASAIDAFYNTCLIYLSTGTGAGQYRKIVNYESNENGRFIQIDHPFDTTPTNGTEYEITPQVLISGTGQTSNATARALVNAASSNSIYRVEMLDNGLGYDFASASVLTSDIVDLAQPAIIRPIKSPAGGHGFDPAKELGATRLCFSVMFANNEGNTILTSSKFQQVGLLKDPLFANVIIETGDQTGQFITGETFCRIKPSRFQYNAVVNSSNAVVRCNDGDFQNQLLPGDTLYLNDVNDANQLAIVTVLTVQNSTQFTATANLNFTSNNCTLSYANVLASGIITNVLTVNSFSADSVRGNVEEDDLIVGVSSGVLGMVSAVSRNGKNKGFDTYVQLFNYIGNQTIGAFTADEIVYQQSDTSVSNSTARFYSGNSTSVYVSTQEGDFSNNFGSNTFAGAISGAQFAIQEIRRPELIPGSGDILYLNNLNPVTRSANTSEQIKFVLEF